MSLNLQHLDKSAYCFKSHIVTFKSHLISYNSIKDTRCIFSSHPDHCPSEAVTLWSTCSQYCAKILCPLISIYLSEAPHAVIWVLFFWWLLVAIFFYSFFIFFICSCMLLRFLVLFMLSPCLIPVSPQSLILQSFSPPIFISLSCLHLQPFLPVYKSCFSLDVTLISSDWLGISRLWLHSLFLLGFWTCLSRGSEQANLSERSVVSRLQPLIGPWIDITGWATV